MTSKIPKGAKIGSKQPSTKKGRPVGEAPQPQSSLQEQPVLAKGVKFVGYREQLLGCPGPSQPHRRMRRWWLKDTNGQEYAAVETVRWDEESKRFEYTPSAEFKKYGDMVCYSHKSVYEYLNKFLKADKDQKDSKGAGTSGTESGKKASGDSKQPKKRKQPQGDESKEKGEKDGETVQSKKKLATQKKIGSKTARKKDKAKGGDEILQNVSKELAMLQKNFGIRYSLTVIGPHGDVKVLSSPTVTRIDIDPSSFNELGYPKGLNMLCDAIVEGGGDKEQDVPRKDSEQEKETSNIQVGSRVEAEFIEEEGEGKETDMKKEVEEEVEEKVEEEVEDEVEEEEEDAAPLIPTGVPAVVERMREATARHSMISIWRRDPWSVLFLKGTVTDVLLAKDFGQKQDLEIIKDFVSCTPTDTKKAVAEGIRILKTRPEPCSESEFELRWVWGIDSFTRNILDEALLSCKSAILSKEKRRFFVQRLLFPKMVALGIDGWDTLKAFELIAEDDTIELEFRDAARDAIHVLQFIEETGGTGLFPKKFAHVRPSGRKFCRSHPKGAGVIVTSDGFHKGDFIGDYVGEMLTAWRYQDRESKGNKFTAKSQMVMNSHTLTITRPNIDSKGFSVAVVDASQMGSMVSRINHSCSPNCEMVTYIVEGELKFGVWALQDIRKGEELTLDFRKRSDFERDLQNSYCLCGSEDCEEFFTNITSNLNPINHILSKKHSLLDRTKILLDASLVPGLTRNDLARLERVGFKSLILSDGQGKNALQIPDWLKFWASEILKFIEEEASELRAAVMSSSKSMRDEHAYSLQDVERLASLRTRHLAISIEKAKIFLRMQRKEMRNVAPLRYLEENDVVKYLWTGENSIAARAVETLQQYVTSLKSVSIGTKRASRQGTELQNKTPWWQVAPIKKEDLNKEEVDGPDKADENTEVREYCSSEDLLSRMQHLYKTERIRSADGARMALTKMAELIRQGGPLHAGLHDLLLVFANTKRFFEQVEFKAFKPVLNDGSFGLRYRNSFLWGLMSFWFKFSGDVVDMLCTDRKGMLCLPDIECCYMPAFTNGEYMQTEERDAFIAYLESKGPLLWPRSVNSFTFKSSVKYFGSPQFDAFLQGDETQNLIGDLTKTLRSSFN